MTPPITDMRLLGQLFRHPEGDYAKEVGDFIFASNSSMINCTIDCLALQPHQKVLEIGFGNGKHLPYLFNKESSLQYIGVETSSAMITEATEYNNVLVSQKKVHFLEVAADKLPNFDHSFDVCFSVNTLYFLENGVNVIIEKPIAMSIQGAQKLVDEKGEEVISERHQKDFKRELYAERLEEVRTNGAANGVTNGAYRNLDFEDL